MKKTFLSLILVIAAISGFSQQRIGDFSKIQFRDMIYSNGFKLIYPSDTVEQFYYNNMRDPSEPLDGVNLRSMLRRINSFDSLGLMITDVVSGEQILNSGETQIYFPSVFDTNSVSVVPFVRRISDNAVIDFVINDIDSVGFDIVVWEDNVKLYYLASQNITHSSDFFFEIEEFLKDSLSIVKSKDTTGNEGFTSRLRLSNDLAKKQNLLVNSSGLASAISDETGTGLAVFNTNPTFASAFNTTVDDVTVTNKNKYRPLLSYDGTVIARFQDYYWNGSAYAADNSFGFGAYSLQNNSGANSSGFGVYSLAYNSGAGASAFGYYSLRNNTGAGASGFGYASLQSNSGAGASGFGYASLQSNSGASASGFGYASLQSNSGAGASGFGYASLQSNSGASASGFGYYSLTNNSGASACGFGYYSLTNNSGASACGFGYASLQSNSGASACGFGYASLQSNSGAGASGFGYASLQSNSGANACGFGAFSLRYNSGSNASGFGVYSLAYNNWANVIAVGTQSTNYFLDNAATDKIFDETCINATNKTITFPAPHGFGATNARVNLRYTTLTGTAPGGLTTNTIYQFTITSATVLTYSGITSIGSEDFTGKLTNSVDINNSIAIGNDVNASKANQVVIGKSTITETQLFGKIGINSTAPDKQVEINSTTGASLRTTYNDADGSAVNYVDYSVTSSGDGAITPSGGDLDINAEVTKGIESSKVPGVLFTQTADKTIANTTTETTLLGSGVGSLTIPANVLIAGKTIRIKLHGFISANTGVNSTVKVKIGSVELVTSTGSTPKAFSNTEFELSFTFTCRTSGATGTVIGHGGTIFYQGLGITTSYVRPLLMTSSATVNTTVSNTFDLTYTWGTADAGNSITCTNAIFEILN